VSAAAESALAGAIQCKSKTTVGDFTRSSSAICAAACVITYMESYGDSHNQCLIQSARKDIQLTRVSARKSIIKLESVL